MAATLWIDVEDLFEYALHNRRPSGIQRVAFQLYRSLQTQYGTTGLVRFVRHNTARNTFYTVTWPEVAEVFDRLAIGQQLNPTRPEVASAYAYRRPLRNLIHRLSPSLRTALIEAFRTQGLALHAWWRLVRASGRGAWSMAIRLIAIDRRGVDHNDFAPHAVRNDVVLALGSPWSHPGYVRLVRAQRERNGLRFSLLVHDLSALRCPEWFDHGLTESFLEWFDDLLPLCDAVFAVSRATAADVMAYAREFGIELPGPVVSLRMGTGLADDTPITDGSRAARQPPTGSYVLFVATIEVRKNHLLLFRIWRRMLDEMPRDQVPILVFAGRVGWLVDDLMQQIFNTDYLFGRLVLIEDASDAELASLYRGCLFTVYPSFFEGWGLPVTESLAFGKPCLASDRTSLPEAGGNLTRYLDPDDLHGWYAAIRRIIEDPTELAQWQARIRRHFKAVPWTVTTRDLLAGLRHPLAEQTGSSEAQYPAMARVKAGAPTAQRGRGDP